MDTCHYTLVQTYGIYNAKREPSCQLWTVGDDVCVGPSTVMNPHSGGGVGYTSWGGCQGKRDMGTLYFPLNSAVKTALNIVY